MSVVVSVVAALIVVGGTAPVPYVEHVQVLPWLDDIYGAGAMVAYPASLSPFEGSLALGPSVAEGVSATEALESSTAGPVRIMCASQGCLVSDQVMADDAKAGVPASQVSFVQVADPLRGNGILGLVARMFPGISIPVLDYTPIPVPVTPYNVTVVVQEYDGIADFPDRWWNLVADVNAVMGANYLHGNTAYVDLNSVPAQDITATVNKFGGVTSTYLVPTPVLPLLMPLEGRVPQPVLNMLNALLRPIVDAGYSRTPPVQEPTTSAAVPVSVTAKPVAATPVKAAKIAKSTKPVVHKPDTPHATHTTPVVRNHAHEGHHK